ncbi:MAG: 4Fe-4S dicluster domain-containing protein [Pseudomonadota bacterium]
MFYNISLFTSLIIFGFGLAYKVSTWFRYRIGVNASHIPASGRVLAALRGIMLSLFNVKIFTLIKVFFLDVLFQVRILKEDLLRWLMHICIYWGFMLLLLMHALDKFTTSVLFPDYYPTLNPFLFLRDLFGALIILGLAIAVYRRLILKVPRLFTHAGDHYIIIIMAIVIFSGILLEGTKITSYSIYQQMQEDYAVLDDAEGLKALEAYWVKEFGVVSSHVKGPFDNTMLARGRELHEMNCANCHSQPQWAFTGYGVARMIRPVALAMEKMKLYHFLWHIHFLACLIGLAYLPFSKMFHLFASPLSLLANAVMDKERSDPANIATRQVMELDACTHCGTCSLHCSVAVAIYEIPNLNILPSERMPSIKAFASGKPMSEREIRDIQEGVFLCTHCNRCTVVCPVGINLQDLWFNLRESLLKKGYPELLVLSPLSFFRGLRKEEVIERDYQGPLITARELLTAEWKSLKAGDKIVPLTPGDRDFKGTLSLSDQAHTFSACFGCRSCTAVCPVVANYDKPQEALGLLPHQIMQTCGLGLSALSFGSAMLWDCLTCYQCQELCPQGVCVTDILYELKNLAIKQIRGGISVEEGKGS